ncbi:hypothetical protein [Alloactinosynnema sp. L-07]|nr:hypothetical protein [Alloactinosynnema sp. L-07]
MAGRAACLVRFDATRSSRLAKIAGIRAAQQVWALLHSPKII